MLQFYSGQADYWLHYRLYRATGPGAQVELQNHTDTYDADDDGTR